MTTREYGIAEAADVLGISPAAVRKRVHRGTLPAHKNERGRWVVTLDTDAIRTPFRPSHDRLVFELRGRLADCERERRNLLEIVTRLTIKDFEP